MIEMAAERATMHFDIRREQLAGLGLPTARFTYPVELAMGGPEEGDLDAEGEGGTGLSSSADPRFRELFL